MSLISNVVDALLGKGLVSVKDKYGQIWYRTTYNKDRDFVPYTDIFGNKVTANDDIASGGEWIAYQSLNKKISTSTEQLLSTAKEEDKALITSLKNRVVEKKEFTMFDNLKLYLLSLLGITTDSVLAKIVNWLIVIIFVIVLFKMFNLIKRR